jgi:hypothetical protein
MYLSGTYPSYLSGTYGTCLVLKSLSFFLSFFLTFLLFWNLYICEKETECFNES